MKSISTINLVIMANMECSIAKAHPQSLIKIVVVLLNHGVSLCIISQLLRTLWVTFQAMNCIRSAPTSSTLYQVSY